MGEKKMNEIAKLKAWILNMDGDPDDEKQLERKLRAYGRKCLEVGRDIQCELERHGHPGMLDLESVGLKGYKP